MGNVNLTPISRAGGGGRKSQQVLGAGRRAGSVVATVSRQFAPAVMGSTPHGRDTRGSAADVRNPISDN